MQYFFTIIPYYLLNFIQHNYVTNLLKKITILLTIISKGILVKDSNFTIKIITINHFSKVIHIP